MLAVDLTEHFQIMTYAILVAYKSLRSKEVPVGCVYYHRPTQRVVASGYNDTNASLCGTRHAEFIALERLLAEKQFPDNKAVVAYMRDVVLYVTVEPCVMCASALKQLGVRQIFFGCANDRFGGNGSVVDVNKRRQEGDPTTYVSYPGILRLEAVLLLRLFYNQVNPNAPQPTIKKGYNVFRLAFPRLNYHLYVSRAEFIEGYGEDRVEMYNQSGDGEVVYANDNRTLLTKSLLIHEMMPQTEFYHLQTFLEGVKQSADSAFLEEYGLAPAEEAAFMLLFDVIHYDLFALGDRFKRELSLEGPPVEKVRRVI